MLARCLRALAANKQLSRASSSRCSLRQLHSSRPVSHGDFEWQDPKSEDEVVHIIYVLRDKTEKRIRAKIGDNVMYLAHRYGIELEGACEASCACSTCHVYVDESFLSRLTASSEEEDDMLDQAPVLRPNSRLGCQIFLSKDLDNIRVTLPSITRNFYVDGHVPQPH